MVIDSWDNCKNGAAISTHRFVEYLRLKHEVTILTTGIVSPGKVLLNRFYPLGFRRIMKKMQTPLAIPSRRILKRTIAGMDIVHIQFPFLLGIEAVRMAQKLGIPVVSTFHIQAEHLAINAGIQSPAFIRYCYKIWIRKIFNPSRMVICPSLFAEEELKQYGLRSPTCILSNGILPLFHPQIVDRVWDMVDKFIILSVGRMAPEKRHEVIIRAVKGSMYESRIQLILLGEGPSQKFLERLGAELTNPPVFLALPSERLVYYYNIADLYIHAAIVEVECMAVLEAMGCSLPVLIADSPKSATRQFAMDGKFLFKADDSDELSNRIDYWMENPQELKQAGDWYYEHSHKYRIEFSVEKLEGIYQSLSSGNAE